MRKNLIQYVYSCTNAFFIYLHKGEDLDLLIKDLERIQTHADENIGGKDCTLWFKFGDDDTLATDIGDVKRDLSTYGDNKLLILSKMERCTGLGVNDELRVFYS
jgi:hypothetical protein|tara:strand:+ start:11490 stop:11801 length:312 start_codon:yes stop_codon:yes gene_type:complete